MDRLIAPREAQVREEVEAGKAAAWNDQERINFVAQCRDIVDYLFPYAGPGSGEQLADAAARWKGVLDTIATESLTVSVSGMMTYAFPVGGGWRSLKVRGRPSDQSGSQLDSWLSWLGGQMETLHTQSNVYQGVAALVHDSYAFGMGVAIADQDPLYTIWLHHVPVGDYALVASHRGQIDTCYRELTMPLRNVAKRWGVERLPQKLRMEYEKGAKSWFTPVTICQAIEPRPDEHRQPADAKANGLPELSNEMAWRSVYWIKDSNAHDGLLSESGYPVFPVLAPRRHVMPGKTYGTGAGQMVLSHVRSLQHRHHNLSLMSSWQSNPMVVMPAQTRGMPFGPGQRIYWDSPNPHAFATPVSPTGKPDLALAEIQDMRRQIRSLMGSDVFALISNLEGGNIRQEHILALREEKMAILGPQSARLLDELSKPLIDITAAWMQAKGQFGDVPEEVLRGTTLIDIELNGILSQASKAAKRNATSQFVFDVMSILEAFPEARHKMNAFKLVDAFHEASAPDPELIRGDDEAAQAMEAESKARAAADQIAMMESTAKTAASLGAIDTSKPNGLTAVRELQQQGAE